MSRNDFLNMIEGTIPFNRQVITEVYEMIGIFPYFQSAHLLLLKGLQDIADIKFESQLRNSAIHIADREVLYYFLKTKVPGEAELSERKGESTPQETPASDTQQTVIESAKNSELLINEIEKDSGEADIPEQEDAVQKITGYSILISTETDNEESGGIMLLAGEEEPSSEGEIFYMDPGFSYSENAGLLELDLEENTKFSVDANVAEPKHTETESVNIKKHIQNELIDKFIIANPRIEPVKDKSYQSAEEITKPFIAEEVGLVTETLAKIYVNQGYYSKAIDIYEKLSLKLPEKRSYFASQIEKVKEYLKK